jgi:hypothetical protein
MAETSPELLMVDPSTLFSEDGIAWLSEDPKAPGGIVVASTVVRWIRGEIDLSPSRFVASEDRRAVDERRELLRPLLDGVATFSYQQAAGQLTSEQNAVLLSLLRTNELPGGVGRLFADEWAFLQSHSFLVSKVRKVLEAFRTAGSVIIEFGERVSEDVVRQTFKAERVPPVLTGTVLARAGAKWLVLGGVSAGGGTLGGLVGTAVGGPAGGVLGGMAGGLLARNAAKPAVIALDP